MVPATARVGRLEAQTAFAPLVMAPRTLEKEMMEMMTEAEGPPIQAIGARLVLRTISLARSLVKIPMWMATVPGTDLSAEVAASGPDLRTMEEEPLFKGALFFPPLGVQRTGRVVLSASAAL